MNRAVGRGPVVDGPRDFLRMGCGVPAFLETLEEVVLGRLRLWLLFWPWRLRAVVLEAPDPRGRARSQDGGGPSSRLGGPRSGTKLSPLEMVANRLATVAPLSSRFRLPHMRHQ